MYAEHVPIISRSMRANVDIFCNGVMFAVLSARVTFDKVPGQCQDLAAKGAKSKALWSWKLDAYKYLQENKHELWRAVCAAPLTKQGANEAILKLCTIPGLGCVKAAFIAQMLGHNVACLDVRNIQREGRNPRAFRSDGEARKRMPAFKRKVERYVNETWGLAQYYWDTWCTEVAPDYGMTPEQVSLEHMLAIAPSSVRKRMLATEHEEVPF